MKKLPSLLFSLLTGGAVGWIVGLSTSPVVATVIASLLSIGFGAIAVVSGFNVLGIQIQGEDNRSSTLSLIALFSGALAVAGTLGLDYKSELARRNIREDVKLWTSLTTLRKEADSISVSVATRIMKSVAYQNPQSAFVASDDISDLSMVSTQAQTLIAYLEQGEQIPSDVMDDKYEFLESLIQAKDIQDSTKLTLLRTIANL